MTTGFQGWEGVRVSVDAAAERRRQGFLGSRDPASNRRDHEFGRAGGTLEPGQIPGTPRVLVIARARAQARNFRSFPTGSGAE
jgi:hypothetical protein